MILEMKEEMVKEDMIVAVLIDQRRGITLSSSNIILEISQNSQNYNIVESVKHMRYKASLITMNISIDLEVIHIIAN